MLNIGVFLIVTGEDSANPHPAAGDPPNNQDQTARLSPVRPKEAQDASNRL